jgi:hypothetical protein
MAERVAEAISKCTFHKHLLFFGFVTCALATHASRADDQTLDLQRASEVQTDLRGTRLVHRLICSWHMVAFKMGRRQGARRAHI